MVQTQRVYVDADEWKRPIRRNSICICSTEALFKQDRYIYSGVLKMTLHTIYMDCGSESQIGTKSTENGNDKYLHGCGGDGGGGSIGGAAVRSERTNK